MPYQQIKPHPAISNYIDAYWIASGTGEKLLTKRILPDGCVDIIVNVGDDCQNEAIHRTYSRTIVILSYFYKV